MTARLSVSVRPVTQKATSPPNQKLCHKTAKEAAKEDEKKLKGIQSLVVSLQKKLEPVQTSLRLYTDDGRFKEMPTTVRVDAEAALDKVEAVLDFGSGNVEAGPFPSSICEKPPIAWWVAYDIAAAYFKVISAEHRKGSST